MYTGIIHHILEINAQSSLFLLILSLSASGLDSWLSNITLGEERSLYLLHTVDTVEQRADITRSLGVNNSSSIEYEYY